MGYWFRQRNIQYVSLYDFLTFKGIKDITPETEYYEFVVDKRNHHFCKYDDKMRPIYWSIYDEKERYSMYTSSDYRNIIEKKIFFLALVLKDFILAETWLDKIVGNNKQKERYLLAWNDIQCLLQKVKEKLKEREQKDIIALWVDEVEYELMEKYMPFVSSLKDNSIWFENYIGSVGFTAETARTIFTGKRLIEDNINDIPRINILNSKVIKSLSQRQYRIIFNFLYYDFFRDYRGEDCVLPFQESTVMLWRTMRQCLMYQEPCFIMNHMVLETHEPSFYNDMKSSEMTRWWDRKFPATEDTDKQLKFYLDMIGDSATSIIFSDHGWQASYRQHVFLAIYGKMYRSRKVSGMFPSINFYKIIEHILNYGEIHEDELEEEYVVIEGVPILRGGKFASPNGLINEATPKIAPPFFGYRGVVTKEHVYFHYAGGREWLSRRDVLQPYLSWYKRPDDVCDENLLPEMRTLAGVDYGNEPEEYGNRSSFYLSTVEKIKDNFPYNKRKIDFANNLIMRFQDSSMAIFHTMADDSAAREFVLMLSMENRKKIAGIIDEKPNVHLFNGLYRNPVANLGVPVFSLAEALEIGIENIIIFSRTQEDFLKNFPMENRHKFNVFGLYGWFALNGCYTKFNFWDFVIESADMKPGSNLSMPFFLHHASNEKAHEIAVVLVTKNDEACIAECLHGILEQVTSRVRIYCFDRNSTDRTTEIIQEYGKVDASITLQQVEDDALYEEINRLLDSMEQKYVLFLSTQQRLFPGSLEYLHEIAEKVTADVVGASVAEVESGEKEKVLAAFRNGEITFKRKAEVLPLALSARYKEWSREEVPDLHGARMYRTEFLREHGIRFLNMEAGGEDIFYIQTTFQSPKYVRVASPVSIQDHKASAEQEKVSQVAVEKRVRAMFSYQKVIEEFSRQFRLFEADSSLRESFRERAMQIFDRQYGLGAEMGTEAYEAFHRAVQQELQKNPSVSMWWLQYLLCRTALPQGTSEK